MKPHEQEWKVAEDEPREVEAVDGCYTVCTVYGTVESRDERAAFIAAAPAMARALMKHGRFAVEPNGDVDVWHTHACWGTGRAMCTPDCMRDRDALRLAGVLP